MTFQDNAVWERLDTALPTLGLEESADLFVFCPGESEKHLRLYTLLAFELATRETASVIFLEDNRIPSALRRGFGDIAASDNKNARPLYDELCTLGRNAGQSVHCVGASRANPFSAALLAFAQEERDECLVPFIDVDYSTDLPGDRDDGLTARAYPFHALGSGQFVVFDQTEYERFANGDQVSGKRAKYEEKALIHQAVSLPMIVATEDGFAWDRESVEHFIAHGSRHVGMLVNRMLSVR